MRTKSKTFFKDINLSNAHLKSAAILVTYTNASLKMVKAADHLRSQSVSGGSWNKGWGTLVSPFRPDARWTPAQNTHLPFVTFPYFCSLIHPRWYRYLALRMRIWNRWNMFRPIPHAQIGPKRPLPGATCACTT